MLDERLDQAPTSWYLTGFLAPRSAPYLPPREDELEESAEDEPGSAEVLKKVSPDEADDSLKTPSSSAFSSTMGLSAYVPEEAQSLHVTAYWGDYERHLVTESAPQNQEGAGAGAGEGEEGDDTPSKSNGLVREEWQRHDRKVTKELSLSLEGIENGVTISLPDSTWRAHTGEIALHVLVRKIPNSPLRSVSVYLINERVPDGERPRDEAFIFQTKLKVTLSRRGELKARQEGLFGDEGKQVQPSLWLEDAHSQSVEFSPAPELALTLDPADDDYADQSRDALIYRKLPRYGTGHHCALHAVRRESGGESYCYQLKTTWRPTADVLFVKHNDGINFNAQLNQLSKVKSHAELSDTLKPFFEAYQGWIDERTGEMASLGEPLKGTAQEHIQKHKAALSKMTLGLALLKEERALDAFKTMNRVIRRALLQQRLVKWLEASDENSAQSFTQHMKANLSAMEPSWRLFQLAFILMNLPGLVLEDHQSDEHKAQLDFENEQVDLLFFPTGGGKTEAYLGLSAFTLLLRRLRDPSRNSGGVSVLMRYTLRLLTLDQLGRIATLICALELERQKRAQANQTEGSLGDWPFEIGLWVGQAMTPNRLDRTKSSDRYAAIVKIEKYKKQSSEENYPFPLRSCPWCGSRLTKDSFDVRPSPKAPQDLLLSCPNSKKAQGLSCQFKVKEPKKKGDTLGRGIPVLMVDDLIYRRLPAFLIATVDKFAQLPWRAEVGALFGQVGFYDQEGYATSKGVSGGQALSEGRLPPPRLIIQDELHLISGPLGTMVGLYEVAINSLSEAKGFPKPKIIASTATARRAEQQVKALYGREMRVFPPPGLTVSDNFFSQQVLPSAETPARQYVGLSAPGRSHKGVQLVASLTLLAGAKTLWDLSNKEKLPKNFVDPYMTIVGYYNTLRELGGSRRIAEDEIASRLTQYSARKRIKGDEGVFTFANRASLSEIVELTSRVSSSEVAESKERLAQSYSPLAKSKHVDLALATNMISVGLDISRLGLMMVLGQPKAAAEYIQATSRVGRDRERPGLVVTLLNHHRSRDRAHFQEFQTWHESFYRRVEANSLTPFSSRALDRGFVGASVGLARHLDELLTPPNAPKLINTEQGKAVVSEAIERFKVWVKHAMTVDDSALPDAEARIKAAGDKLQEHWKRVVEHYQQALQYGKEPPVSEKPLLTRADEPSGEDPVSDVPSGALDAPMSLRDVESSIGLWRIDHIQDSKDWPHWAHFSSKTFKVPPEASLRRSQLITTFGPGAMLDLPDCSAIVAHNNTWNKSSTPLNEPRLQSQVASILNAPHVELYEPQVDSKTRKSGVGYYEFPGWMLVNTEQITNHEGEKYRRRLLIKRTNGKLHDSKKGRSGKVYKGKVNGVEKQIYDVVPIRFVQACPKGHLSDIDWHYFVHQGSDCSQSLHFDEAGSGHNFVKILVACGCGKKRKLADAKKPKGLGRCNGGQPWIRLHHRAPCLEKCGEDSCAHARCPEDAHLLTRTASNAYFSNVVSVLSLPPQESSGPKTKGAMYKEAVELQGYKIKDMKEFHVQFLLQDEVSKFFKALKAFDEHLLTQPDQVWSDIQALQAELDGVATEEQKETLKSGKLTRPEIDQFMSVPASTQIGKRYSIDGFKHFEAERLLCDDQPEWFKQSVDRVILMHRLREVSALVGFTRLEPLAGEDDIPIAQQMQIERAPLTLNRKWVPAVENLGEGVFLSLNPQRVQAWQARPEIKERMRLFERGKELMEQESISQRAIHPRDAAYVLLHTLAHALIEEISLSCGYSASSLKERIYSFEGAYGILIYTGTPSSDGTLGGLVDQSAQLPKFLAGALKRLTLCASDPICSSHEPQDDLTKRYLHGAACHSCSLISETSCAARNLWLDRAFVVPTLSERGVSFYSQDELDELSYA